MPPIVAPDISAMKFAKAPSAPSIFSAALAAPVVAPNSVKRVLIGFCLASI